MATYPHKTVLRCYNETRTAHKTAVIMKDGKLLEVKGDPHTAFDTADAWIEKCKASDFTELVQEPAKPTKVKYHGFRYIKSNPIAPLIWTNWLYRVMKKYTPELLTNAAVKDAFNAFVKVLTDNKDYILTDSYYLPRKSSFKGWYLIWDEDKSLFGYPGRGHKDKGAFDKSEFGRVYKALYDLIHESVGKQIDNLRTKDRLQRDIKSSQSAVRHYERRIQELSNQLTAYRSYVERCIGEIDEKKATLASLEKN